jgi:hypothetical protein
MTEPASPATAPAPAYSPQLRTALVFTGTGTAGAYHAGVLRALTEAAVKIDMVGGHGIGVVAALFAAVDSAHRLWDDKGFWRSRATRTLYPWRRVIRVGAAVLFISIALVAVPIVAAALGLIVYPIDFVLKMVGIGRTGGLIDLYLRAMHAAFAAEGFPTWLPRLVVLALGTFGVSAFTAGWIGAGGRRTRGPFWWRMVKAPISSVEATTYCWRAIWDLVRGAARLKQPSSPELGRRYIDLVGENLGQPGFKELVLVVHDLDARRDMVFALVDESRRRSLIRRATSQSADERRAEVFDLNGVARDYLADVVAGALAIPLAADPRSITFTADSHWRGETHRLCDRPEGAARVLEEFVGLGAEQVIVVSAAADPVGPHALTPTRLDGRGRLGEYLRSFETALVRDLSHVTDTGSVRLFNIRPAHNPIGPLDFERTFDDRSDRRPALDELLVRGYEDAYHQFIEPVVGASGDELRVESESQKLRVRS